MEAKGLDVGLTEDMMREMGDIASTLTRKEGGKTVPLIKVEGGGYRPENRQRADLQFERDYFRFMVLWNMIGKDKIKDILSGKAGERKKKMLDYLEEQLDSSKSGNQTVGYTYLTIQWDKYRRLELSEKKAGSGEYEFREQPLEYFKNNSHNYSVPLATAAAYNTGTKPVDTALTDFGDRTAENNVPLWTKQMINRSSGNTREPINYLRMYLEDKLANRGKLSDVEYAIMKDLIEERYKRLYKRKDGVFLERRSTITKNGKEQYKDYVRTDGFDYKLASLIAQVTGSAYVDNFIGSYGFGKKWENMIFNTDAYELTYDYIAAVVYDKSSPAHQAALRLQEHLKSRGNFGQELAYLDGKIGKFAEQKEARLARIELARQLAEKAAQKKRNRKIIDEMKKWGERTLVGAAITAIAGGTVWIMKRRTELGKPAVPPNLYRLPLRGLEIVWKVSVALVVLALKSVPVLLKKVIGLFTKRRSRGNFRVAPKPNRKRRGNYRKYMFALLIPTVSVVAQVLGVSDAFSAQSIDAAITQAPVIQTALDGMSGSWLNPNVLFSSIAAVFGTMIATISWSDSQKAAQEDETDEIWRLLRKGEYNEEELKKCQDFVFKVITDPKSRAALIGYHNAKHFNELFAFVDAIYKHVPFKDPDNALLLMRAAIYMHDLGYFNSDKKYLAKGHEGRSIEKFKEFLAENPGLFTEQQAAAVIYMIDMTQMEGRVGDSFKELTKHDNRMYYILAQMEDSIKQGSESYGLGPADIEDLGNYLVEKFPGKKPGTSAMNIWSFQDRRLVMDTIIGGKLLALADIWGSEKAYLYLVIHLSREFSHDKLLGDNKPATLTVLQQAAESSGFQDGFAMPMRLVFLLYDDEYPILGMHQYLKAEENTLMEQAEQKANQKNEDLAQAKQEAKKQSLLEKRKANIDYSKKIEAAINSLRSGFAFGDPLEENLEELLEVKVLNRFIEEGIELGIFNEDDRSLLIKNIQSYINDGIGANQGVEERLDVMEALETMELWDYLSPESKKKMLDNYELIDYQENITILEEDAEPNGEGVFIILSGRVVVRRQGYKVAEMGAGNVIGEIAALRRIPRTATVEAGTNGIVEMLNIPAEVFREIYETDADFQNHMDGFIEERLENTNNIENGINPELEPAGENGASKGMVKEAKDAIYDMEIAGYPSKTFSDETVIVHKVCDRVFDEDFVAAFKSEWGHGKDNHVRRMFRNADIQDQAIIGFVNGSAYHLLENSIFHVLERNTPNSVNRIDPAQARVDIALSYDGQEIILEITDNGEGMNKFTMSMIGNERIKKQGKRDKSEQYGFSTGGHGDALYDILEGLVRDHGGFMEIDSMTKGRDGLVQANKAIFEDTSRAHDFVTSLRGDFGTTIRVHVPYVRPGTESIMGRELRSKIAADNALLPAI